jgi:hypothetical protein
MEFKLTEAQVRERMETFKNQAQRLLNGREQKEKKAALQQGFRSLKEQLAQEQKDLERAERASALSEVVEHFYVHAINEAEMKVRSSRWNSDPFAGDWYSAVYDVIFAMDYYRPK